jgi:hypothetical protein
MLVADILVIYGVLDLICRLLQAFTDGFYKVTVTNAAGCNASDSTEVITSTHDLEMTQVITAINNVCTRPLPLSIEFELTNRGEEHYGVGEKIPVAYKLNNEEPILDTIVTADSLHIDSSIIYTFGTPVDMSYEREHALMVYANNAKDLNRSDDTIYIVSNTWGIPMPAFDEDTIFSSQIDTLILDAGDGFVSYLWQDLSDTRFFDVASNVSQWYTVAVNDINGCGPGEDSIFVNTTDLYVIQLMNPVTACENSSMVQPIIRVYNNSGNAILAGETIRFNFSVNEGNVYTDIVTVNSDFIGESYRNFTLTSNYDFSDTGNYNIRAWLSFMNDANNFNDSISTTIRTKGYPDVEFEQDTIFTLNADTIVFDAGDNFASYLWQNGSTNQTFNVITEKSSLYAVTVSNEDGCGEDSDSVYVFAYDISVEDLNKPQNSCELSENQQIRVKLKNVGKDSLYIGDVIPARYRVNESSWVTESIPLDVNVAPSQLFFLTFSETIDMSSFDVYAVDIEVDYPLDARALNNSKNFVVESYGYPEFELNYSFINSTQPDTVNLIVTPSNYAGYLWNVGVNNDTLSLAGYDEQWYSVTVSNINGCTAADSAFVNTSNLTLTKLLEPVNECQHSTAENVSIRFINSGSDTIPPGTEIEMNINIPIVVEEAYTLQSQLAPGDSVDYTFTQTIDLSAVQVHTVEVAIISEIDALQSDNLLTELVESYGPAVVDLGNEVTINSLPYTLDAGSDYLTYLWHDNSTEQTFDITSDNITSDGLYSVTVTNSLGCEGNDSRRVNVEIIDWALDQVISPFTGCFSDQPDGVLVQISNQSDVPVRPGRSFFVNYSLNGGTEVSETFVTSDSVYPLGTLEYNFIQMPDYQFNTSGVIEVSLDNADDINSDNDDISKTFTIYDPVFDFPEDTLYPEMFPYVITAPDGYSTYSWSTGDNTQSTTVTNFGWYYITISNSQGCYGTDSVYVADPNSLNSIDGYQFTIWPNPANNELYVKVDKNGGRYFIEFISMNGATVYYEEKEMLNEVPLSIPIGNIAEGVYIIKIYNDKTYMYRNFIIKR